MLSIIHFISASRRLTESEKTIHMLGGSIKAPTMILAQRDMIKLEKEYYYDKMIDFLFYSFIFSMLIGLFVFIYTVVHRASQL